MSEFDQQDELTQADAQMPLSMLTADGEVPATPSFDSSFAEKKSSMGGMMLLAMVLLVATGVLLAMRMTGGVAAMDTSIVAAEKKIDEALKKLSGQKAADAQAQQIDTLFKDADAVVTMFASDPSQKQVTPDDLQKNPFEMFIVAKPGAGGNSDTAAAIDKMKAERLKQIKAELEQLKLQSLLNGRKSLAVINGKVYNEGDVVGSFTITSISPSGVRLTADGNTYTLVMEKPEDEGVQVSQ